MKIELHKIRVRELCADYNDLSIQEEGIVGYGGRLNTPEIPARVRL